MRKRIVSYALLFVLVVSFASLGLAYSSNEKKQLNDVQGKISDSKKALNLGKAEEKNLLNQIQTLEGKMFDIQVEIESIKDNINETQGKINVAIAELNDLEARLEEQDDRLNARLRAMYMGGSIGVLDVLLGSDSISDFMTNMDRIQLIYESDREVIESLEEQHRVVDAHRQHLLDLQASLVADRNREASKKEALKKSQDQIAVKKTEVAENNKLLEQYIDGLTAEANRLIAEIIALQSDKEYIGGIMKWPVPGASRITSEFGNRMHPILKIKKFHTGIDIAAPTGTSVVAANAGSVIKAGWNDSYGYMVMIDHGGGIVTLYAHNSSLLVKTGDIVVTGDKIAKSGSTGMSTGPHVHFEVRKNGSYVDPIGWVKP